MSRIVIVDDYKPFCIMWADFLASTYPGKAIIQIFTNPFSALPHLDSYLSLLLIDYEMPQIDGKKFLEYATNKGVNRSRIIITSAKDINELHRIFPPGSCLAVINKDDPAQNEVFLMILDSVMKKLEC
ncbi:MAG: histidine kinase [Acidobacteria bacterium]|nr:histidine kinase [Acidobacteriota bacterium]